jgi:hypothetical protein
MPAQKLAIKSAHASLFFGEMRQFNYQHINIFFGALLRFRCSFHEFQRRRVLLPPYPPLCSAHRAAPWNPAMGSAPEINRFDARRWFSKKRALTIRNHRESNSIDREHGLHGSDGFPRIFVSVRIRVIRVIRVLS